MKIIQLTNMTSSQMMGYVLQASTGELLVIDGGAEGNEGELERIITALGGHVQLWLITHPHKDHHDAVIRLLSGKDTSVTYDRLGASRIPDAWAEGMDECRELYDWNAFGETLDDRYFEVKPGQKFQVGSMCVEVLAGKNPELTENAFNNQSCVYRVTENGFRFLVLGDLGEEAGEKLLASDCDLRSDAVQMAHHGQQGVRESFYRAVSPRYAFWPTPLWLWENRRYLGGGDFDCGPFATRHTIRWMEALGAENILSFTRTVMFDTETRKTEEI